MILAVLIVLLALVMLFTSIQTLYLEGMRLRTRDLPSLQYFKSDLEPRLNLRSEEGALTFSLWKHTCLVLFGVTVLAQVIDGGTLTLPVLLESVIARLAADDAVRVSDSAVVVPPHFGPVDRSPDAVLRRRRARDTAAGAGAELPALAARHHNAGSRSAMSPPLPPKISKP